MQFQGQVSKNIILTSNARNMGNTSFCGLLTGESIYSIMLGIQGRKVNSKVKM